MLYFFYFLDSTNPKTCKSLEVENLRHYQSFPCIVWWGTKNLWLHSHLTLPCNTIAEYFTISRAFMFTLYSIVYAMLLIELPAFSFIVYVFQFNSYILHESSCSEPFLHINSSPYFSNITVRNK